MKDRIISDELKAQIYLKYGDDGRPVLKDLLDGIEDEHKMGEQHKKKHFRTERLVRWMAFCSGVSGSILALWTFETMEVQLCWPIKGGLTLFSVFASFGITALSCLSDTEKNRETWLRHSIYVNKCKNECLEYAAGVGKYKSLDCSDAGHVFLDCLIKYRKENDEEFRENMSQEN